MSFDDLLPFQIDRTIVIIQKSDIKRTKCFLGVVFLFVYKSDLMFTSNAFKAIFVMKNLPVQNVSIHREFYYNLCNIWSLIIC